MIAASIFFRDTTFLDYGYIVAFSLFILGLHYMTRPQTARHGNRVAAVGVLSEGHILQGASVGPGEDEEMGYRSAEELKQWRLRDPVLALRRQLAQSVEQMQLEQLESGIDADIHSAIAAAKRAEWADFNDIIDMNWSGEYASVVEFKSGDVSTFAGSQAESLPGPF